MSYPEWLQQLLKAQTAPAQANALSRLSRIITCLHLDTVCQSARCPNLNRCWGQGAATFMILGNICTRNCSFCNLQPGVPQPVDHDEPWRLLPAVRELGLRQVVITSVTRDDLIDGGAGHFSETIRVLRRGLGRILLEVLTPDFQGKLSSLETLAEAAPDIWGHNLETVPRLYPLVRSGSSYERSLNLLTRIKQVEAGIQTKSGLMLGLGETSAEVAAVLKDLRQAGIDHLTLGQYLAPSRRHFPVARYVPPEEFTRWHQQAVAFGFRYSRCGPLVRSSYRF